MAITNATISAVTPGTTETALYTASGNVAITVIYLCNTDSITRTVDIHLRPAGETKALENKIYSAISIPAGDTYTIDTEKLVLANTDVLSAVVGQGNTASAVVSTVSALAI